MLSDPDREVVTRARRRRGLDHVDPRECWYRGGGLILSRPARMTRASSGVSACIALKQALSSPTGASVAPMMNSGFRQ